MARRKHSQKRRGHPIASVLLALVALLAMMGCTARFLSSCSSPQPLGREGSSTSTNSYYTGTFTQSDGRATYTGDGITCTKTGIDVSEHQGSIDWPAVAADGISFAMVRVGYRGNTEGYLHKDELFEENLAAAQAAGLECGVYFYSQALTEDEAREEAAFVLDALGGRELSYPVAFDFELSDGHRIGGLDSATATACARVFCEAIREGGYRPMLYGNTYDLQRMDLTALGECPIWYAEYGAAPSRGDAFSIWQYSCTAQVGGVSGACDLNLDLTATPR